MCFLFQRMSEGVNKPSVKVSVKRKTPVTWQIDRENTAKAEKYRLVMVYGT